MLRGLFVWLEYPFYLLRKSSTFLAICLPEAIARTTRLAPLAESPHTKTFLGYSGCSGLRKPIASRTSSALMISGLPAGTMMGRAGVPAGEPAGTAAGFQSISCTFTPVNLPFSPRNPRVLMFQRRVQPSLWLLVVLRVLGRRARGSGGSGGRRGLRRGGA